MAPQTGVNGVLPASVLQKNPPPSAPRGPKAAQPRLKLVLRRLPPGLTKAEFESILGDDWKLGGGKVDWFVYKKGKISKEYVGDHISNHMLCICANAATARPSPRGRLEHISMSPHSNIFLSLVTPFARLLSKTPPNPPRTVL
jgi:hypothetical protein